MGKYDVNFRRLALLILPTFWRKPLLTAVAYASVSPITILHSGFLKFRKEKEYGLTHNGQVCYLRAVLNDNFDPAARRITITDAAASGTGVMLAYARDTGRALFLPPRDGYPLLLNRRGYGGVSGYDFIVNIPYVLEGEIDTARLKAVVNTYKLASKRFGINYI